MKTTTHSISLFLLLALPITLVAQSFHFSLGSSFAAAETGTARTDAFAVFNNPAAIDSASIGIAAKRFYLLEGINNFTLAGGKQLNFAGIGVGLNYFGDELYNETTATVGVSKSISETIHVGASIYYFSAQAIYAEQSTGLFPQLGLLVKVNESFQLGSSFRNPLSQDLKEPFQYQLQSHASFGGQYIVQDKIISYFQTDLLEDQGLSAAIGFHYQALDKFSFQLGGRLNPGFASAGIQLHLTDFKTNIGSQFQENLGFTPGFAIEKDFK